MVQTVLRTTAIPQLRVDKMVDVLFVAQTPFPMVLPVQQVIEIPQLLVDKVFDVPGVQVERVPQVPS